MRFIKNFFGVACCIVAFGFTIATEQVAKNMQPFFVVLALLFIAFAVLLFRKTGKEKQKKATPQFSPTIIKNDVITFQSTYIPDLVPDDIAKDMKKHYNITQAKRELDIMSESYKLASTTLNLETFCTRYGLAQRYALTLLQAEQVGVRGIKSLNCTKTCIAVVDTAGALKIRILNDFEQEEIKQAEALKTDKGKQNRYSRMLQALIKAEPTFIGMEEYASLIDKTKHRLCELGGVVL